METTTTTKTTTVRVNSPKSKLHKEQAKWLRELDWTDKQGNRWHVLEFEDGFRCGFPRDEFEVKEG